MKDLTDCELWRGTRMGNPVFIMGPVIHPQANQFIHSMFCFLQIFLGCSNCKVFGCVCSTTD